MKKTKNILIIILCLALLVGGFFFTRKLRIERKVESLSNNIEEQVNNLAELAAIRYNYTNIAEYSDKLQFNGINLPFSSKAYLVKYSGYLKAGVDMEDIEIDIKGPERVEVILPDSRVLDNVISEEDVYFYNEKDSAFNRLKFDDLYELLKEEKIKMEKELIEKGILNDADKNVMSTIRLMLESLGVVEVVFK